METSGRIPIPLVGVFKVYCTYSGNLDDWAPFFEEMMDELRKFARQDAGPMAHSKTGGSHEGREFPTATNPAVIREDDHEIAYWFDASDLDEKKLKTSMAGAKFDLLITNAEELFLVKLHELTAENLDPHQLDDPDRAASELAALEIDS